MTKYTKHGNDRMFNFKSIFLSMKKSFFLFFLCAICGSGWLIQSCSNTPARTTKVTTEVSVPNFGLFDHTGDFHRLHYYDNADAIVLFIQGNKCPIVRNAFTDFKALESAFADENVKFFMMNSNVQDSRESVAKEAAEYEVMTPILIDSEQLVADVLDVDITAEAFVIDPKDWSLKYRGPLNDRIGYESQKNEASSEPLKDAIQAVITGSEVAEVFVNTKGCAVVRKMKHEDYESLTYTDDISHILKDNCFECHQKGGIAPWAMESYNAVFGWSAMIKNVLLEQRMPPWQADPHYGEFKNNISLTEEEKRKLLAWIAGGLKKGDGEDLLASATPASSEWANGEPDYIITLKQEDIPATGIIDYRYQAHTLDFDKDVFVQSYQILPGNTSVLHHVLANVEYPDGEQFPIQDRKSEWLDGILIGWAPGGTPETFPEGSGKRIPKGSTIYFQNHYTTSGKAESDVTRIGLYLNEDVPEKEYLTIGPANFRIKIPPNEPAAAFTAVQEVEQDITLYQALPHMHYRGKSMNFVVKYPDGETEKILNVPGYNFNWQRFYNFKTPKSIPAGSKIYVNAIFDNSAQNEFNPDPSQTLYFGEQTFDEMLVGYLSYTIDNQSEDLSYVD